MYCIVINPTLAKQYDTFAVRMDNILKNYSGEVSLITNRAPSPNSPLGKYSYEKGYPCIVLEGHSIEEMCKKISVRNNRGVIICESSHDKITHLSKQNLNIRKVANSYHVPISFLCTA